MSLPSCFRVRAGLSQEDEMSVYEAGNQESQHSAPGCGNKAISSCSSQEGESALAVEQLATGPGRAPGEGPEENQRCCFNKLGRL